MILVDTNIWIGYLQRGRFGMLTSLLNEDQAIINDIILAELLPYLYHANQFSAAEALKAVSIAPLDIFWPGIIQLQADNLANGVNRVGIPDLVIAQQALQNDFHLWSEDKHFGLMKGHTALKIFVE
jgi:predicted nucleic acid-binding protein